MWQEKSTRKKPWSASPDAMWLWRLCQSANTVYFIIMGLVVATSLLALVDPLVLRWLIDAVLPQRNSKLLIIAVSVIVGVYVLRLILHAVATSLNQYASQKLAFTLRMRLIRRIFSASQTFISVQGFTELTSRVEQDVTRICESGGSVVITLFRMLLTLTTVIGVMFYLNWELTALLVPTLPGFLFVRRYYRGRLQDAAEQIRIEDINQRTFLHDVMMGIADVQLAGAERHVVKNYGLLLRGVLRRELRSQRLELWFGVASALVISTGIGVVFSYGGFQVFRGSLTVGGLIAFYSYFFRLFDPLSNAVEATTKLQRVWSSVAQARELEAGQVAVTDHSDLIAWPVSNYPSCLSCKEVCFTYPNGSAALNHFTMEFRRGEFVAIVGTNGSGKTSVVRLLSRLYDATGGVILCDGYDLRSLDIRRWRKLLAIVQQRPALFAMSFRDNITLGVSSVSLEQLERAVEASGLAPVIARFPNGLDEHIGPGGSRLSGGEAQRLAIARTLLAEKPILILDEATSALDPMSEAELLRRVRNHSHGRITICITHRSYALKVADRVVLVESGRVLLDGQHDKLWSTSSLYREYWLSAEEDSAETAPDANCCGAADGDHITSIT